MEVGSALSGIATSDELLALALLVAGVIVGRFASLGVGALLGALERRAARVTMSDESVLSPGLIRVSRVFVFWLLVALAVLVALRVLGIAGPSAIVDSVLGFTPRIFVAFSIIVAGHLLGLVAAHLATRLNDDVVPDSIGPRLLHVGILTAAVVIGLQHVGVDISFITRLLLVLAGTVSAGLMLAFALGARGHVANLLARRELSRLNVGERVRVGDVEGTVVEIHSTGIEVAVADGIASIPASRLAGDGFVRVRRSDDDA